MGKYVKPTLKSWCVSKPAKEVGKAPPAKGASYRVKDGDSWVSLAAEWGLDVWSLIYFNFRTYDPKEVNYYLGEYVGCVLPTADRKNWCFSSAAEPGIIYRPLEKAGPVKGDPVRNPPMPMPGPVDDPMKSHGTGNWVGVGVKGGGHIVLGGVESTLLFCISLDDYRDWMILNVTAGRVGPGLGASGGLVVAGIGNCYDPNNMKGWPVGGYDFQLAVGAKWGSLMKVAAKAGPLVEAIKYGGNARSLINKSVFHLARRAQIVNEVKNGLGALGLFPKEKDYNLSVNVVDIPIAGVGAELSAYYGSGSVQLVSYGLSD
ncbi:MAG TPA: hypothetical protein VG796_13420 [Verrucomicrobiales bacterium]|nr:hypothetical protein [Verrucomicrobiales bacterium]